MRPPRVPFLARLRRAINSIRTRLTLGSVAVLALVLLAFSGFVYTRQARDLQGEAFGEVQNRFRQLEGLSRYAAHESEERGTLTIPARYQDGTPLLQEGEELLAISPQGQIVQKLGAMSDAEAGRVKATLGSPSAQESPRYYPVSAAKQDGFQREDYIFVVRSVVPPNNQMSEIAIGRPVDPTGQLPRLFWTLLFGSLGLLGLAVVGGYWLAGRVIRPVEVITRTAREISATDLSRRLNLGTQDELGELAGTFDRMLDRLQASFERQRQFTADASHELRTPLTIVELEASRALARRRSMEEYEQALAIIKSENETMGVLVNDLLTLARMDAGQTVLRMEVQDLSDLALEVVERLAPLAQRKGVELSTGDFPEVRVMGDRQYLIQMLTNLVENAIKYAVGEEKRVRVETGMIPLASPGPGARAGNDQAGEGWGWLRVIDNGPGIPAEHLPHLFDRFYRVDKSRGRLAEAGGDGSTAEGEPGGSGLGLSIVQWIAQAHGGEIRIESEVGKGSTFEVRLPAVKDPGG